MVLLVKVEGTLEELRELLGNPRTEKKRRAAAKKGVTVPRTKSKSTVKRTPSAYNKYMKKELARLKKAHPRMTHQSRFKKAAKSWKGSKKKKGGRK